MYDAEVETPRNDAGIGLLLLGDGGGNFASQTIRESGIYLPYDVKHMLRIDGQNKTLVVVGVNGDAVQVLAKSPAEK